MEDHNVPVLVDAKAEYTMQLIQILLPHLYNSINKIYEEAKEISYNDNESNKILMNFQNLLSNIPKWNQEIVNEQYNTILNESGCDYLEDLLTAIIVSHTKVLTAIKVGNMQKKINITIPKIENFIHKTFIQLAREFWKNPYLFDDEVSKIEYQRNIRDCEKIISESIQETIRKQLPVKHILKEYLGESYEEEIDGEEDVSKTISEKERNNIKKMIHSEFEEYSKNKSDESNTDIVQEIEDSGINEKHDNIADIENNDEYKNIVDVENNEASEDVENNETSEDVENNEASEGIENNEASEGIENNEASEGIENNEASEGIENNEASEGIENNEASEGIENNEASEGIENNEVPESIELIENIDKNNIVENITDIETTINKLNTDIEYTVNESNNVKNDISNITIDENIVVNDITNRDTENDKETISLNNIKTPDQSTYQPITKEDKDITDLLYGDNNTDFEIEEINNENNSIKIDNIDNLELNNDTIKKEVLEEFKDLKPLENNIKTIHIDDKVDSKKKKIALFDDATELDDDVLGENVKI